MCIYNYMGSSNFPNFEYVWNDIVKLKWSLWVYGICDVARSGRSWSFRYGLYSITEPGRAAQIAINLD